MPSGVVLKASVRRAFATAALVEHDDAVYGWIEEAAKPGRSAASRAAVHDSNRLAQGIAAFFEIHCMNVGDLEHASVVGVNVWVKLQAFG